MVFPDVMTVYVQNYTKDIDTLCNMLKLAILNKECALETLTTPCDIVSPITLWFYFNI